MATICMGFSHPVISQTADAEKFVCAQLFHRELVRYSPNQAVIMI